MIYLGIDPGKSGAIAWIGPSGPSAEPLKNMTDREVYELLRNLVIDSHTGIHAYIEQVNAMSPGRRACFVLGGSYMALKMALAAACIPYEPVLSSS